MHKIVRDPVDCVTVCVCVLERLSHLDADPHELALWVLLKRTRSSSRLERLQAVQELAHRRWQGERET